MAEYIVETGDKFTGKGHDRLRERIIRCRDCRKWSDVFDGDGVQGVDGLVYGECAEFSRTLDKPHYTPADGFCKWGERSDALEHGFAEVVGS